MDFKMKVGYSMIKSFRSIKNICSSNVEIRVDIEYN